jgi:hypothetical protein
MIIKVDGRPVYWVQQGGTAIRLQDPEVQALTQAREAWVDIEAENPQKPTAAQRDEWAAEDAVPELQGYSPEVLRRVANMLEDG